MGVPVAQVSGLYECVCRPGIGFVWVGVFPRYRVCMAVRLSQVSGLFGWVRFPGIVFLGGCVSHVSGLYGCASFPCIGFVWVCVFPMYRVCMTVRLSQVLDLSWEAMDVIVN